MRRPARADRSKPRRIPAQDGKHPSAIALCARAPRRLWVNVRRQHSVQGGCSFPSCCRSIRIRGLRIRAVGASFQRVRSSPLCCRDRRIRAVSLTFTLDHFCGGESLQGTLLVFTPGRAWSSFFSLLLSKARRASARKIIKIRLVSLVAVFLLRDFKAERPRLDQSTIWLFVRSKRPINASGFACHVISPLLCAEHHREIAPGRARVKGFRF